MSKRLKTTFDLKLLTSSTELALRRLRSYAAALGGGAQIFHNFDELRHNLLTGETTAPRTHVVCVDASFEMNLAELQELMGLARVYVMHRSRGICEDPVPSIGSPVWATDFYAQCSQQAWLESPIVRLAMAQMVKRDSSFELPHFLRWGHAASVWTDASPLGVADHCIHFVRHLRLGGVGRRLAEMFSHFVEARLADKGLHMDSVIFGSDGLVVSVIAQCRFESLGAGAKDQGGADLARSGQLVSIFEDLRVHEFPFGLVNRRGEHGIEIAGLAHAFASEELKQQTALLVFNKPDNDKAITGAGEASETTDHSRLNKAG